MANCNRRRPPGGAAESTLCAPLCGMEADAPMNRYLGPESLQAACTLPSSPACRERGDAERVLLEQLVELSAGQNQLLIELLGAVNALTAALLAQQLRL